MKPVRWHPIVLADVERAGEYYRAEGESLDKRFIAAVNASVSLIRSFPGLGAPVHGRYRRVIVHRFPYSVVYREHSTFLRIVAVTHQKLDPSNWVGR